VLRLCWRLRLSLLYCGIALTVAGCIAAWSTGEFHCLFVDPVCGPLRPGHSPSLMRNCRVINLTQLLVFLRLVVFCCSLLPSAMMSASPATGSVVKASFPAHACKTVYFIRCFVWYKSCFRNKCLLANVTYLAYLRHAEATSNKAADGLPKGSAERHAAYDDPRWFDARLSEKGEAQCVSPNAPISYFLSTET
jgi:hypothetical protein